MDLGALGFLLLGIAVYLGFSLWCFVHFLRKYLRWRRNTPISGGKQACIILPPVLLILALFLPMLARLPEELPASREELKELTAQVDAVRQYEYTRRRGGRYASIYYEYRHYISLKGYTGSLLVPENFGFDQEEFLDWAGTDPVTFRYALTGGRATVYEIQGADGSLFLDYSSSRGRLLRGVEHELVILLSGAFLLGAGAVYLPAYLYPPGGDSRKWWRKLGLLGLVCVAVFGIDSLRGPKVTDTPAGGPPPVVAEVTAGVRFTLPQGWEEGAADQNGNQWYKVRDGVSTCFHIHRRELDLSQGVWRQAERIAFRDHLLETYVTQPRTDLGPFLQNLYSSAQKAPGTDFWVSEGWGASQSGAKNHFLLIVLPQRNALLDIQSCTSSQEVSWGELETYVEEEIWPLLSALELPEE